MQVLKNRDRRDTWYKLYFFDIKAPAKEPKFYKTVLDIISNKIIFVIVITLVLFPFFQNKMDICVFFKNAALCYGIFLLHTWRFNYETFMRV